MDNRPWACAPHDTRSPPPPAAVSLSRHLMLPRVRSTRSMLTFFSKSIIAHEQISSLRSCVRSAARRATEERPKVCRSHRTPHAIYMSWTNARPTGGSYVRGSPAVGFIASEKNTPLSASAQPLAIRLLLHDHEHQIKPDADHQSLPFLLPVQCHPPWPRYATQFILGTLAPHGTVLSHATL